WRRCRRGRASSTTSTRPGRPGRPNWSRPATSCSSCSRCRSTSTGATAAWADSGRTPRTSPTSASRRSRSSSRSCGKGGADLAAPAAGRPALSAPGEIRVLLVGGDPLARSGLAALLAGQPGLARAGQAAPDEAASAVERLRPDVLLWDLGAGAASTADPLALPNLEDEDTGPPALVLVPSEDLAAEALAAGARGLLFRDAGAARLAAALQALALGLVVVDEALAAALARPGSADAADHPERAELIEPLAPRA